MEGTTIYYVIMQITIYIVVAKTVTDWGGKMKIIDLLYLWINYCTLPKVISAPCQKFSWRIAYSLSQTRQTLPVLVTLIVLFKIYNNVNRFFC